jgi:NADPH-dependent ferric siderophore reductase
MTTDTSPTLEGADAPPPRRRRVMRRVRVTRVEQLSPRMVRVTFTGDDLGAFAWNGPAAHIKLIFPEEGQAEPSMPQPDGPRPTRVRTYTPRRFDPAVPELDVEFVLHGDGPASTWAAQAHVGQSLNLGGPGPSYQIDPGADWFLLIGDDAALPAIETILDALPAEARVRVVLEVADEPEERPLSTAAQLDITWLHRGAHSAQVDTALEDAVHTMQLPAGNRRIYVGCEAAAMRRIRTHLLHERGLDPATIVTRGYWKLGAIDYTDHDYGTDSDS